MYVTPNINTLNHYNIVNLNLNYQLIAFFYLTYNIKIFLSATELVWIFNKFYTKLTSYNLTSRKRPNTHLTHNKRFYISLLQTSRQLFKFNIYTLQTKIKYNYYFTVLQKQKNKFKTQKFIVKTNKTSFIYSKFFLSNAQKSQNAYALLVGGLMSPLHWDNAPRKLATIEPVRLKLKLNNWRRRRILKYYRPVELWKSLKLTKRKQIIRNTQYYATKILLKSRQLKYKAKLKHSKSKKHALDYERLRPYFF